jgi:hypothetical protein
VSPTAHHYAEAFFVQVGHYFRFIDQAGTGHAHLAQ